MMAARMGDSISHGGEITSGEPLVLIEGLPAAREGDSASCDIHGDTSISTGSVRVLIGGMPAARIGDETECGASIESGAVAVLIGD